MTIRKPVQRLAGAVAAASGVLLLATGPASAANAAKVESGWWNEAAAGPVDAPSTTSSGQLQVSSGLQGPLAFAAVRIGIPADIDPASASVTLTLVQVANRAVGTVAVSACPTTSSWSPGDNQPASSAPGYDCTKGRQVDAIDSDGQDSFSIPAGWASGSNIEVAIVPTPGTTAPFSVQYDAPTARSAVVSGPPPGATTSTTSPPVSSTVPGAGFSSPAGSGSNPSPSGTGGSSPAVAFVPPDSGSAAATPAGPSLAVPAGTAASPAPALSPAGGVPAGQPARVPAVAAQSARTVSSRAVPGRAGRILAVSVLLLLGVVLFGLSGYQGRSPVQLVPIGGRHQTGARAPEERNVGGIGRFAKPRTGPPRRL